MWKSLAYLLAASLLFGAASAARMNPASQHPAAAAAHTPQHQQPQTQPHAAPRHRSSALVALSRSQIESKANEIGAAAAGVAASFVAGLHVLFGALRFLKKDVKETTKTFAIERSYEKLRLYAGSFGFEFSVLVLLLSAVSYLIEKTYVPAYVASPLVWTFATWFGFVILKPLIKTNDFDAAFYKTINKPWWTPPNYVFPLVWTPVKILQVIGCTLIWAQLGYDPLSAPILVFAAHLALGDLWNKVFFGQYQIGFSLVVMYSFYATLLASVALFYRVDPTAAYLLLPGAVWVTIASSLNLAIWSLNSKPSLFPTARSPTF